ncbi:metalloregulator ArsR/SmtB family transcription factor [Microaerobacter geothermalis]|uniref:ArsR/SmtB family transcription factor n=1 Tax=Microaerobacter geothermalis TaxID=674972 RepID=UPI001F3AAF03|nr:metalloregulator ArsR/SmtB family transcription factor [Microaerobacter geothermalis]MCF6093020.1 metalloregulator ArsR/SmtB family transcription factor [Microaerobacter geothermalis]
MTDEGIKHKENVEVAYRSPGADDECETFIYDPQRVERRKRQLHRTEGLAPLFKALADDTRLKIIYALSQESELCVCDVATIIGSTNATASHHLRLLKNMGLAKYRKEGKMVFYSLQSQHVHHLIQEALGLKGKEQSL